MKNSLLASLLLIAGPIVSASACDEKSGTALTTASAPTAPTARHESIEAREKNLAPPVKPARAAQPKHDRPAQPNFLFM